MEDPKSGPEGGSMGSWCSARRRTSKVERLARTPWFGRSAIRMRSTRMNGGQIDAFGLESAHQSICDVVRFSLPRAPGIAEAGLSNCFDR
jgi:hypothetical protein